MTDDGRHISRRERRAQEEREAANVPADTDALSLGPISESIPTHAPDGRMLTRRERRRLERARQPMETWTAEEEMIATGQIPAMTPERIAEQEKLARERAAAAQREAQEASAELEGLAGNPAVAQSAAAPATEPVVESASEPEQQHPWAPVTPAPVEPHADQPWAPVTQPSAPAPAEQEAQQPWSPSAPATSDQEVATEFVPEPAPAWAPAQPHDENPSGGATPPERTSLIAAVAAEAAPTAPVVESAEHAPEESVPSVSSTPTPTEPTPSEAVAVEPIGFEATGGDSQLTAASPATAAEHELPPSVVTPAVPAPVEPAGYEPEWSDEPAAQASPAEASAIEVHEEPEPQPQAPAPAIPGMPPGMTPEMFAQLFPPGSLQRRLMEDQAAAETEVAAEPEDPAAEIRRLADEAVAGLDAVGGWAADAPARQHQDAPHAPSEPQAHVAPSADVAPSAGSASYAQSATEPTSDYRFEQPPEQPSPWGAPGPASQSAPDFYGQPSSPSAPAIGGADSGPPTFSIPALAGDVHAESVAPSPAGYDSQPVAPSPARPTLAPLDQAPFDAVFGDHPESAALDEASGAPADGGAPQFGSVGVNLAPQPESAPQDGHGFTSAPVPAPGQNSPWGAHPLSQVDREAPELPEMPPAQGVPQPDLSGVGFRPQTGPVPIVEPVPTGQIEVPPRDRPELTGADVPRHFKWAHLAVFGAVGLLLGVVVWQVI